MGTVTEPTPTGPDPTGPDPLEQVAIDLDRHAATTGWDAPARLYALVPTAELLAAEPSLRAREDLAAAPAGSLTPVEQDPLPEAASLHEALARVVWPSEVAGAALVVERLVVPPDVERQMPRDEQEALDWLAQHPRREEVRMTVAVLRGGRKATVLRLRSHDSDAEVLRGPDLVPGLSQALAATLVD